MLPRVDVRRTMARPNLQLQFAHSPVLRYGLAVTSFAIALGLALLAQRYGFRDVELPLFLFAVAVTVWYAGIGSGILAVVLSSLAFDYFFTEPRYSFYVRSSELPYYAVFILFALLLTWFSAVRRRVEQQLLQSRNELQMEVVKRTQQASLLNLTHDTIFVRDMSDIITYWNRGAQELYGWRAEEAIGKSSHELLRTIFPTPLDEIRSELLRTGRWEGELKHKKADGTDVIAASRWALQRDSREQPVAVLETNNDVTERKRREDEIKRLNQELAKRAEGLDQELAKRAVELEATNKELESFAYSVSHDLRAPLRHTLGYAELLQRQASSSLDEKSRRYMEMILESAKKMGALIDDLLGFSRIGRAEANESAVDLEQLVGEVVAELGQETKGREIAWKIGPLPVCTGDRSMLKVVFVNLLSNAVKFTRIRKRAEIEIGCLDGREGHAELFVRDNGAGFDMKYVDKLFGVFQRLHLAEEFEGTGIGLATVQRILHRHGGEIRAEGAVDQGATFYFSVPRARMQEKERGTFNE